MKRRRGKARRPTTPDALVLAKRLHRDGRLDDAEAMYDQVLLASPDSAQALHYAGVLDHQRGRSERGLGRIRRSLELMPDQPDAFSNLGIVYRALDRLGEAEEAFRAALRLAPDHANARSNLGVLLRTTARPEEAEEAFRRALHADPDHPDAHHNLGVLLAERGRPRDAVVQFCRAITLSPAHREARRRLVAAHATLGELDEAVRVLEAWLAEEPDDPIARHLLAACSGAGVPERASDGFVESTFDRFAGSFDKALEKLRYQAPRIVAAMLEDGGAPAARTLDVLDAGCGTGLCGPLVAPWARRLVGVDLSAGMLERARERGVYHELAHAELTTYLQGNSRTFDLIVSADTLVYFGPLAEVAHAAAGALRPGGAFLFTVEAAEGDATHVLLPHGRYAHGRVYVEHTLRQAGFAAVSTAQVELRLEAGVPVPGWAVRGALEPATLFPNA